MTPQFSEFVKADVLARSFIDWLIDKPLYVKLSLADFFQIGKPLDNSPSLTADGELRRSFFDLRDSKSVLDIRREEDPTYKVFDLDATFNLLQQSFSKVGVPFTADEESLSQSDSIARSLSLSRQYLINSRYTYKVIFSGIANYANFAFAYGENLKRAIYDYITEIVEEYQTELDRIIKAQPAHKANRDFITASNEIYCLNQFRKLFLFIDVNDLGFLVEAKIKGMKMQGNNKLFFDEEQFIEANQESLDITPYTGVEVFNDLVSVAFRNFRLHISPFLIYLEEQKTDFGKNLGDKLAIRIKTAGLLNSFTTKSRKVPFYTRPSFDVSSFNSNKGGRLTWKDLNITCEGWWHLQERSFAEVTKRFADINSTSNYIKSIIPPAFKEEPSKLGERPDALLTAQEISTTSSNITFDIEGSTFSIIPVYSPDITTFDEEVLIGGDFLYPDILKEFAVIPNRNAPTNVGLVTNYRKHIITNDEPRTIKGMLFLATETDSDTMWPFPPDSSSVFSTFNAKLKASMDVYHKYYQKSFLPTTNWMSRGSSVHLLIPELIDCFHRDKFRIFVDKLSEIAAIANISPAVIPFKEDLSFVSNMAITSDEAKLVLVIVIKKLELRLYETIQKYSTNYKEFVYFNKIANLRELEEPINLMFREI